MNAMAKDKRRLRRPSWCCATAKRKRCLPSSRMLGTRVGPCGSGMHQATFSSHPPMAAVCGFLPSCQEHMSDCCNTCIDYRPTVKQSTGEVSSLKLRSTGC
jgi:hypothetical protein